MASPARLLGLSGSGVEPDFVRLGPYEVGGGARWRSASPVLGNGGGDKKKGGKSNKSKSGGGTQVKDSKQKKNQSSGAKAASQPKRRSSVASLGGPGVST